MSDQPDLPEDESAPEIGEEPDAAEGQSDFWDNPDHDDSGLDLAKSIAKATASSSLNAPRRKKRTSGRTPPKQGHGGRPKASGAHPDERDPQTLDVTLGRLVTDHGWLVDLKVHGVFGRWPDIVGEEVAQHCTPTTFEDGQLTVQTDSTAWATQLRLLAPTVVRRLNEELGHGTVTVIEVVGPNLPSWKKGRFRTRGGQGPRDTYG